MATVVVSSSDEDDDIYLNSVAKLKALKSQKQKIVPKEIEIEEQVIELQPDPCTSPELETPSVSPVLPKSPTPPISIELRKSPIRDNIIVLDPDFSPEPRVMTRSAAAKRACNPRGSPRSRRSRGSLSRTCKTRGRGRGTIPEIQSNDDSLLLDDDSDLEILSLELAEIEEDNYEMDIKVLWRSKDVHRLSIKRNESFQKVFQYFADLENVTVREISITKHEKAIKVNDTPESVALSVIDILEGGVVKKPTTSEDKANPDARVIKVQTTSKKTLSVTLMKDANFGIVYEKCAQELGVERSKMKLYFDGDVVEELDTPDSLDIEDEACFDLRISS